MQRLFLTIAIVFIPLAALAYTSPGKPTGLVNDFARILSAQESQAISAKLNEIKTKSGVEVAVVTVATYGENETIESYAEKLFKEWGIGNKEKNMGLLLLVAVTNREMRIETGYGVEGAVTDIQAGNIIRNILTPAFRDGKYGLGISGAIDALDSIIMQSPEAAQYSSETKTGSQSGWNVDYAGVFFFVIIIINILSRVLGKTKSWWLGGVLGAIVGAVIGLIAGFIYIGVISIVILTILGLIFDFFISKHPPGSSGRNTGIWPIFFGGGRGGSSGGFGGFGGGMSGGGGASGRW